LLTRMHRTRKARGVVMFVDEDNLKRLLHTLDQLIKKGHKELERRFWFVASDSWGIKQSVVLGLEHLLAGSITIVPHVREEKAYITFFRKLSPTGYTFLEEYWDALGCGERDDLKYFGDCFDYIKYNLKQAGPHRCFECEYVRKYSRLYPTQAPFFQESYVPFVVDAVRVLARALSKYIADDCGQKEFRHCHLSRSRFQGDRLQKYYRNVSIIENEPPLIDANGDGIGRYDVFQLDSKGVYHKVGKWRSSKDSFEIEVQQVRRGLQLAPGDSPLSVCSTDCPRGHYRAYQDQTCCWTCIPCDTTTSIIINGTRCDMCPEGKVADVTQSFCVPIPPVSMRWDTAWALIPASFSLLGLTSTIFVVGVFLKFSNTPVIMASGRELCYCMIAGISMCYVLTFFLVSQPSIPTCAFTRVLMGLSMSAIYAAIITKTNRLARVFKPNGAQRPRFITPKAQVGICASIVSVQLAGSIVWLLVDPPGTKVVFPSRTEAVLTCKATASHLLVSLSYNLLLIIACTVYAFKTRKIPENFNETRHIGFTMYSTCILWLSFGPIYFATQNNFRIQVTSLCMCISLSGTVALVCFFAPKVYIVLFQPYKNVRTRQSAVGRLVNQQMRFMR
uniref:G_PROTEIN_RECEP_F3_4 domain-containing protein n=1 Tax=Angiostrongylus cantonensis TaxID=6313 RepID=A0A158P6L7_ANGCA